MKKLKVVITYTGEVATEPKTSTYVVDADQEALNIPIESNGYNIGIKTYKLWEMYYILPNERKDLNLEGDILMDKWIEEQLLNNHPYANRITNISWQFYDEENKPMMEKFEDFLNL